RRCQYKRRHARLAMFLCLSGILGFLTLILLTGISLMHSAPPSSHGILVVANQKEHTALLIDPDTHKEIAKIPVGINGHEVTLDKAGKFAYVPIYGDSGVGKPGSNGSSIDVIDITARKLAYTIDLGK